jgi:large subunit ribosomal protein L10
MGLNRTEKAAVVDDISGKVAAAGVIIVAEYRGLGVQAITVLRKQARSQGVHLRVLKNTLARRALAGTSYEGLSNHLVGPLLYGIADDPVACAKVLSDFAKSNDKLVVKAGAMPNFVMDAAAVKALAALPSRDELLAKLLGTMQAPVATFVRTLNEVPGRFVRTLAAIEKQQTETAA